MEAAEFPVPFAGLTSACINERSEGLSEFGVDRRDEEHQVDVPGCPEIEARCVKQQVAGGDADDGALALVGCEMFVKPVDSGHRGTTSDSRSAAMETRSSR